MPAIETLRSTHAFLGRKRDRAEAGHSGKMKSSPIKDTLGVTVNPMAMRSFVSASTLSATSTQLADPSTRKKWRPRRIYRPQEASLFDLLNTHSGETLFISPIAWTNLHLQLLDVKFVTLPRCDTPHPEPSPTHREFPPRMIRLSKQVSNILASHHRMEQVGQLGAASRVASLHGMLRAMFPSAAFSFPQSNTRLFIWVWGEPFQATCRLEAFFESCDGDLVAFVNKDGLEYKRRHKLYHAQPGPGGRQNDVVHGLMELRIKKLLPANRDHDPYLVALFIALAQKRFYRSLPTQKPKKRSLWRDGPMPEFEDVTIRIITNDNGSEISIYKATVTATFLERFHMPTRTPKIAPDGLGMTVQHTKVAAWPLLGLKERLGRTLGSDLVCEEFSEYEIDTWGDESDTESVATVRYPSRTNSDAQVSRQFLGEITNDKVEDEVREERAGSPLKKRRLI